MADIGKFVWVGCPRCEFAFPCAGEYVFPHKVTHPRPDIDRDMFLRCPRCKQAFRLEESKLEIGGVPPRIPVSLADLP
jgi:uncharacterized C2H2 Zn-finger protein